MEARLPFPSLFISFPPYFPYPAFRFVPPSLPPSSPLLFHSPPPFGSSYRVLGTVSYTLLQWTQVRAPTASISFLVYMYFEPKKQVCWQRFKFLLCRPKCHLNKKTGAELVFCSDAELFIARYCDN